MRPPHRVAARRRRGKFLVLTALLMPATPGFLALTADLGGIALCRAQLMTVADAAALAGAQKLADDNRLTPGYVPTAEMAAATTAARAIGQANAVLGAAAVVNGADVVIGERDYNTATLKWAAAASPLSTKYNS